MEDRKSADAGTAQDDAGPDTAAGQPPAPGGEPTSWWNRPLLGRLTIGQAALLAVVVGPLLGFLGGMIGAGEEHVTTSVDLVIDRQDAGVLEPGTTDRFPVLVHNPTDEGAQVVSISAGASEATAGGCPAGTVTSAALDAPAGYISPEGVRTYSVDVTMAADAGERCLGQPFTLPLTIELATAG